MDVGVLEALEGSPGPACPVPAQEIHCLVAETHHRQVLESPYSHLEPRVPQGQPADDIENIKRVQARSVRRLVMYLCSHSENIGDKTVYSEQRVSQYLQ